MCSGRWLIFENKKINLCYFAFTLAISRMLLSSKILDLELRNGSPEVFASFARFVFLGDDFIDAVNDIISK